MDYQKIHDSIIYNSKKMEVDRIILRKNKLKYFEKHHIIPKCLGGSNDPDNLVLLTAKEHYIIHRLLCKIYPENNKLKYAIWNMCNISKNLKYRYKPSPRLYESIRLDFSKSIIESNIKRKGTKLPNNSGVNHFRFNKKYPEMSERMKGDKNPMASIEHRHKNNFLINNPSKKIHYCEFCSRNIQGSVNFLRWHGSNCKNYS